MQDNWDESCVVADGNYSSSRPVDFYCGKISQAIIALFPPPRGIFPKPVGYPGPGKHQMIWKFFELCNNCRIENWNQNAYAKLIPVFAAEL